MKVLNTLLWLKKKNIFYKDIIINYQELDNQEDKFIPTGISFEVLQYDPNYEEQEGYSANFSRVDNYKNELYHILDSARINTDGILSNCLYTNADDTQMHSILKLLSVVINFKNNALLNQDSRLFILIYINKSCLTPLNNQDN